MFEGLLVALTTHSKTREIISFTTNLLHWHEIKGKLNSFSKKEIIQMREYARNNFS